MEKKRRIVSTKKANPVRADRNIIRREFNALEDTKDLSFLAAIAADGTNKAYLRAVAVTDAIVELENGRVVRRQKDGSIEVIANLDPRKEVQKGETVILR